MNELNWVKLIGGGFCHMTAPFAVHPQDRKRANEYLKLAKKHEITHSDAVEHAREYLSTAKGWPCDVSEQLTRVRTFFAGKLSA